MCGNGSGGSAGDSFDAKAAATDRSVAAQNRDRGGTAVADSDGAGARVEAAINRAKKNFNENPVGFSAAVGINMLNPVSSLVTIPGMALMAMGATPAQPDGTVNNPERPDGRDGNEIAGRRKVGGGPTGGGGGGPVAPPSPVRTVLAGRRFGELGGGNIRRKVLLGA